jgi:hypothetical protein
MPFTITCCRLATSVLGAAAAPLRGRDGEIVHFRSLELARLEADRLNTENTSPHVSYRAEPGETPIDPREDDPSREGIFRSHNEER